MVIRKQTVMSTRTWTDGATIRGPEDIAGFFAFENETELREK